MAAVWQNSQHAGTNLLMLLALADFSDDHGNSYPAVETLAGKCRIKPRNARYVLNELRASGELEIRPNEGPKGVNRYRIKLEAPKGMQHGAPLHSVAPLHQSAATPALQCTKPLHPSAAKPSMNHQEPKKTRARAAPRASVDMAALLPGVDPKVLADWQEVRRSKRATVFSETAADQVRKQAEAAGLTLQQAIEICCARNWVSFRAEWVSQDRPTAGAPKKGRFGDEFDPFLGCE
jgi:hypothetical protein